MNNIEINSCYGSACRPNTLQLATTPSTGATVVSAFDGNGIDGCNIFISPEDVVKLRDWFNERVRQLIFEGKLDSHIGD